MTELKQIPLTIMFPELLASPNRLRATHVYVPVSDLVTLDIRRLPLSNIAILQCKHTHTHDNITSTNQQSTKAIYFFDRIKVRCEVLQLFKTWDFWRDLKCVMQDDLVVLTETVSGQKRAVLNVFQPLHIAKNPLSCQISNPHLQQTAVNMFLRGIRVALKCLCFMLLGYFPYTV